MKWQKDGNEEWVNENGVDRWQKKTNKTSVDAVVVVMMMVFVVEITASWNWIEKKRKLEWATDKRKRL